MEPKIAEEMKIKKKKETLKKHTAHYKLCADVMETETDRKDGNQSRKRLVIIHEPAMV